LLQRFEFWVSLCFSLFAEAVKERFCETLAEVILEDHWISSKVSSLWLLYRFESAWFEILKSLFSFEDFVGKW